MDLPAHYRIGRGYSRHRTADPRIVGCLAQMLGPPENGAVVDVGAETGNYAALAGRRYRVVAVGDHERPGGERTRGALGGREVGAGRRAGGEG